MPYPDKVILEVETLLKWGLNPYIDINLALTLHDEVSFRGFIV